MPGSMLVGVSVHPPRLLCVGSRVPAALSSRRGRGAADCGLVGARLGARCVARSTETTVVGLLCVGAFGTKRQSRRTVGAHAASKEHHLRAALAAARIPLGPPIK